ncbi:PDC sensor domain-containing protein [Myxococcus sp. Y35]|uniref:PDC sensor domain-containing protein n=1 Tax=Pseudomyxococcus flavus TaxID=3115648 RepID=UPI003CFAA3D1
MSWFGLVVVLLAQMPADGVAQMKKVDRLIPQLQQMALDPRVIQAVREQNARRASRATIEEQDKAWMATPALTPFKEKVLSSPCSRVLNQHLKELKGAVAEAFVMDNQGALVGSTRRTSNYWQGDEAKFTEPFKNGTVLREKPSFDESSQSFVLQISFPVRDGGRTIGALSVGVSLLAL